MPHMTRHISLPSGHLGYCIGPTFSLLLSFSVRMMAQQLYHFLWTLTPTQCPAGRATPIGVVHVAHTDRHVTHRTVRSVGLGRIVGLDFLLFLRDAPLFVRQFGLLCTYRCRLHTRHGPRKANCLWFCFSGQFELEV